MKPEELDAIEAEAKEWRDIFPTQFGNLLRAVPALLAEVRRLRALLEGFVEHCECPGFPGEEDPLTDTREAAERYLSGQ